MARPADSVENWILENILSGDLKPGDYVAVEIADTGKGIPENELSRIFEPFFSTKFVGRGLDLAIASNIVKSHDGGISVISKGGQGSVWKALDLARSDQAQRKKHYVAIKIVKRNKYAVEHKHKKKLRTD